MHAGEKWVDVLRQEKRWVEPTNGFISNIEAAFPALDLHVEAIGAVGWLSDNSKRAQAITSVTQFFWRWCRNAVARDPPAQPDIADASTYTAEKGKYTS